MTKSNTIQKTISNLVDAIGTLLCYIDAIPAETVNAFPAMPGCNRDELEGMVEEVKRSSQKIESATVTIDGCILVCAISIRVKHSSIQEYIDWLAGQNAIASTTGFLGASRKIAAGSKTDHTEALYLYQGDPKEILPALPAGQSYVWTTMNL